MTTAENWAIATDNLTKVFGPQTAVDQLSLRVPHGSVFGFLGPNGSGKTTTIRMLLGLATASSGSITLLGQSIPKDVERALPRVGALVEGPAFYPFLSGRNNLMRMDTADRFSDPATRVQRVDQALARVGLTNAANKKAGAYSLGMKQRLGIANALLKPRELLILDEPTNGLDPQGTREVRQLIRQLSSEGITIFLSSHLLQEIEALCSHVAVMNLGKLVAQGSLDELRAHKDTRLVVKVNNAKEALTVFSTHSITASAHNNRLVASVDADFDVAAVNAALVKAGVLVSEIRLETPSLEEYFVDLTGEGFDVGQ